MINISTSSALRAVDCQRIYEEKLSGAQRQRPELNRLARSTQDLLEISELLSRAGVGATIVG